MVVGSNLFGDILSDLGPAVAGSIGIAPSANLNPERRVPLHVRAGARLGAGHRRQGDRQPDRDQIWSVAMMLDFLKEAPAAKALMAAIETVTGEGKVLTRDLGGKAGTKDVTDAVLKKLS